jgi:dipeptidyl aminopeptidase/acylaminoacyl peptidase
VPSWSPDGSQIAFASTREDPVGYWHIYVVGVNGGTPYRVTQENSWAPAWTPDGQIIYMSNRDGDQELFLINADGSNDRRLTDNRASEENPNMAFGQRATVADVMTVANRQGTVYVTASGQRQRLDPGQAIDINLSTPSPTLIFPVIANSPLPRYGLITDAEAILTSVGFSSID